MNTPVRRVAIAVLVLFGLLVLNVNYIQVVRADAYRADPGNTRVLLEEYTRQRGSIVVDGTPIAESTATPQDQLQYLRVYPGGPAYAPATGYYSLIYATAGIERSANDLLAGSADSLFVQRITDMFTGRDPKGGNVVLTLDPATQQAAYQALVDTGATGSVVALDPATGAILALASNPSYDPAQLSSHDPAAIRAYSDSLDAAAVDPRVNRATSERYPPGSVFKILVAAAALENGLSPQSTIPAPDVLDLPQTSATISNFGGESCNGGADDTVIHALTISCNTAFAALGMQLGESTIRDVAQRFGIDEKGFEVPIPVAGSTLGDIADAAALAQSSLGQRDVALTPMQAAMIVATVANGGELFTPYLVAEEQAPDLTVVSQTEPDSRGQAIDGAVADQLTEMMVSVVANGTGRQARIDGIDVAGKTGTAEVTDGVNPYSWFTGFAPAADPRIAVAVFVDNRASTGAETTGGEVSAPIARTVMQAYLSSAGGN